MKTKILAIILLLLPTTLIAPVSVSATATSTPYDNYGISSAIINSASGKYIDGKEPDLELPYASLTKLMTALVLLDLGIDFNKHIVVTKDNLEYVNPYISAGDMTSKINLRAGDEVTANDLWHAMLIASSNEAAIALVKNSGIGLGSFVRRMNSKAKAWGLTQTYFREPTGIDPKNVGTAREMALIARRAYQSLRIDNASRKESYMIKELNTGRRIGVICRNLSLLAMQPIGMKVGYLTEAKLNAAVRLKKDGKDRIVVVLHSPNSSRRNIEINRLMKK